jgi:hypothetical protein
MSEGIVGCAPTPRREDYAIVEGSRGPFTGSDRVGEIRLGRPERDLAGFCDIEQQKICDRGRGIIGIESLESASRGFFQRHNTIGSLRI